MTTMDFGTFMQQVANSISLGSLYALLAIGYTLVYGILRLINFAHGDIFMLGAYFAFYAISAFTMPWFLAFPLAILLTILVGVLLERGAYRPLRNSPRIAIMISAIGASYLIENLGVMIFGGRPKAFPNIDLFNQIFNIGSVSVSGVSLVIPVVTLVVLLILFYIINKTKTGMAMRAVSKDYEAARLMGIDVNTIITVTFAMGSGLAAVGAIMWGMKYPQLIPLMGLMPGLKCFIAAVIGGIGDVRGAVIGGFILGFGEIMIVAFFPELSGYRDAFAFVVLIFVLLVKPAGIMGKASVEKV
ncbi:branched-chain amino acid ABC transporter permease [Sinanaerobacter chloroacetimidivorans]|jgi:branched-chain amino acid transport system permease protein|uniref:Branched-chain amino acid ABC transporter permease n=1 Tax=Sinanaerobacter chloroacetimidivorans TaxID=2818044 RepID=A0A8J8B383_9FIRM|nr:branched-chain amino acid ABC transporter permease [Sinanaerobacter chloroacetimidivorans]MBR0598045.1 branched-chain amino acid ABC transporter permease [Sinanaerobacter chloroacetimidivorans]